MTKIPKLLVWLAGGLTLFTMMFSVVSPVEAQSAISINANDGSCTPQNAPHGVGYYMVKKGETAQVIANKFHVSLDTVLSMNPGVSFTRGTVIQLPAVEGPWDNALLCSTVARFPATGGTLAQAGGVAVTGATSSSASSAASVGKKCGDPAPFGTGFYYVQKGETPQVIANKFHITLDQVLTLNPGASFRRGTAVTLPAVEGPWNNQMCP
jgi:LysM repeat protein